MANALIQFRIDKSLKDEATYLYENIGLDLNSAIKLFIKRSVKEAKLPFSINPNLDDIAMKSRMSRVEASTRAKKIGLSNMTMDEIDNEIKKVRARKRGR